MMKKLEKEYEFYSLLSEDIYNLLRKNRILTRRQLVELLGKPRTTVYDNITPLIKAGLVTKFVRRVNVVGRPMVFFKIVD